jgi:hypothetical protein
VHFICSGYNGLSKEVTIPIFVTKLSQEELMKKLREGKEELRKMKLEDDSLLSSLMGQLQNTNNDDDDEEEEETKEETKKDDGEARTSSNKEKED